jgi:hypothetical protein
MSLTKIKNNNRYNDLKSIDCQDTCDIEEEHREESNYGDSDHCKRVSIPTIVISNEKCTSTMLPEAAR